MKNFKISLYTLLLIFMFISVSADDLEVNIEPTTKVMQICGSALIRLHVISSTPTLNGMDMHEGFGSGVIISPDGYAVTNHHVAGNAVRIFCTMPDKSVIEATLVGTDALTDIAVVKLNKEAEDTVLPYASFGNSDSIRVGDQIFALGSPLAFSQSVTMGVVSNPALIMSEIFTVDFQLDGERVGSVVRWIAHDALILPGNSGGPLVNTNGEIIGINELLAGLSCSIPGNVAKQVSEEIIAYGEVKRSEFGITLQPVLQGMRNGVLVSDVKEGSNAAEKGMMSGDIVISIDGVPVDLRFTEELPILTYSLMSKPIGESVVFEIVRGNSEPFKVEIIGKKREKAKKDSFMNEVLGVLFEETKDGLRIISTKPSSPLNKILNIQKFSILATISDIKIESYSDLSDYLESLETFQKHQALITLKDADGRERLHVITIDFTKDIIDISSLAEQKRPWIPIETDNVSAEVMEYIGISGVGGVEVLRVYEGEGINSVDLKKGDIIIKVDGKNIGDRYTKGEIDFSELYKRNQIDDTMLFTVLRDNNETDVKIALDRYPVTRTESYNAAGFDFTVRELNFFDKTAMNDADIKSEGAYVTAVKIGGWAGISKLRSGDIIVEADDKRVDNIKALKSICEDVKAEQKSDFIIKVYRSGAFLFLSFVIQWDS